MRAIITLRKKTLQEDASTAKTILCHLEGCCCHMMAPKTLLNEDEKNIPKKLEIKNEIKITRYFDVRIFLEEKIF